MCMMTEIQTIEGLLIKRDHIKKVPIINQYQNTLESQNSPLQNSPTLVFV